MIVQCVDIYNIFNKEYLDENISGSVAKGNHYNVLEIDFSAHGIFYRIVPDHGGLYAHSILVRAQDFKIISAIMPSNWTLRTFTNNLSGLSPVKWTDNSLWDWSFWEDFGEDKPKALACFREELKTILATDKDYIATMITERKDYVSWRESMLPLLNEVL